MKKRHFLMGKELTRDTFIAHILESEEGYIKTAVLTLYNNQMAAQDIIEPLNVPEMIGREEKVEDYIAKVLSEGDTFDVTDKLAEADVDGDDIIKRLTSSDDVTSNMAFELLNQIGIK